jgi:hypothetical protein
MKGLFFITEVYLNKLVKLNRTFIIFCANNYMIFYSTTCIFSLPFPLHRLIIVFFSVMPSLGASIPKWIRCAEFLFLFKIE